MATAIEMTRKEGAPAEEPARLADPVRDPLREAQRRCQQLGQSAADAVKAGQAKMSEIAKK